MILLGNLHRAGPTLCVNDYPRISLKIAGTLSEIRVLTITIPTLF